MSRRKDGGFPRRKHGNCNKPLRGYHDDPDDDKMRSNVGSTDKLKNRQMPPPDLKGKALGLWYRDREREKQDKPRPPPELRGKALGMWYRDRARETQNSPGSSNENKRMHQKRPEVDKCIEIKLEREKLDYIEKIITAAGPVPEDNVINDFLFRNAYINKIKGSLEENIAKSSVNDLQRAPQIDKELMNSLESRNNSVTFCEIMEFRKKLPSYKMKDVLVETIANNTITVISGETGCGKTTQVAQFILDEYTERGCGSLCNIVCTQPRRISAVSVAERVAAERCESIGRTVGYQIRLEKVLPKQQQGTILFVTTGILLQWMQQNPCLNGITHLFIDEVHERDCLTDFTIAFMKLITAKRPNLKLILMSATLNAERFSDYYGGVPCLHIPGFTYPVEDIYLEQVLTLTGFRYKDFKSNTKVDRSFMQQNSREFQSVILPHIQQMKATGFITSAVAEQLRSPNSEKLNGDLIVRLIRHICDNEDDGAILVFVPGLSDIQYINKALLAISYFNNSRFVIIPLHSTLSTVDQRRIFNRPPQGVRKIVIATNIAETSITIDDVVYVIDSGFIKMSNFNLSINVSTLDSQWISLANGRQRRGRAGRVQPGKCYKLYTSARESLFEQYPLPEMQRTRLEEVVLQSKMLQLGRVAPFFAKLMDPPDEKAVDLALDMLKRLNALNDDEQLTPLGYHLAKLPMDPQTGKMILMSAIFSCVDPILSIAASLSYKEPFRIPFGLEWKLEEVKKRLANGEKSDHLVLSNVFREWETACEIGDGRQYVWDNCISHNTMFLLSDMKKQFAKHLHEMKFLTSSNPKDEQGNVNSDNIELVKAVLCSGLYPNIAVIRKAAKHGNYVDVRLKAIGIPTIQLHPKSICKKISVYESPFMIYHQMIQSSSIFIHDATMISPWPLVFFGEKLDIVEFDKKHGVRVNELIKFDCFKKTGVLIQKLRSHLNAVLANAVSNPAVISWSAKTESSAILRAILALITAGNDGLVQFEDDEGDDHS